MAAGVGARLAREDRPAEAARALRVAAEGATDPADGDRRRIALGAVLLRARAWGQALDVLSRVEAFGADEPTRARARRLFCAGLALSLQTAGARDCAASLLGPGGPQAERVAALLDRMAIDPERRARIGGVLSAVVPGLGQATAGEPIDGGLALLVNGGWEAGTIALATHALYVDATLLAVGAGLRYWLGNVHHGAAAWRRAAERTREEAARELARTVAGAPGPPP